MQLENDDLSDAALIRAARKRLLSEFDASTKPSPAITNNVYNTPSQGGLMDHLGGGAAGAEDPFDYYVDVSRKDAPINPDTGKPGGWEKSVHRHRDQKKK